MDKNKREFIGKWNNQNQSLRQGWQVPCYLCNNLTNRSIESYADKYYICSYCFNRKNITYLLTLLTTPQTKRLC